MYRFIFGALAHSLREFNSMAMKPIKKNGDMIIQRYPNENRGPGFPRFIYAGGKKW